MSKKEGGGGEKLEQHYLSHIYISKCSCWWHFCFIHEHI